MYNNEKGTFNYTYSAKQQEEIRKIRKKYIETDDPQDKMERLRKLDASVTQKATILSLVFGIIGALLLGSGMSLVMTDLSIKLSLGHTAGMIIGIVIGVIGMALVGFAYPVYNQTVKKEKEKIAPEIIRLTDELMN